MKGKIPASKLQKSLSARRAWIEIIIRLYRRIVKGVALRKESVDRNVQLYYM